MSLTNPMKKNANASRIVCEDHHSSLASLEEGGLAKRPAISNLTTREQNCPYFRFELVLIVILASKCYI